MVSVQTKQRSDMTSGMTVAWCIIHCTLCCMYNGARPTKYLGLYRPPKP